MANRYWVGGSAAWDATNVWSTTSGGAGGASNPTSADDVFIDQNGPYTISAATGTANCRNMTVSGSSVTIDTGFLCYGSLTTVASTVIGTVTSNLKIFFEGSGTITLNGATVRHDIWFSLSATVSYTLGGAFTTTGVCLLNKGTLTSNNYNITVGQFDVRSSSGTTTLNLGTSTLTLTTAGTTCMLNAGGGNTFNFNWSTGAQITCTASGSVTLNGGAKSLPLVNFNNSSGSVNIQNSNTFADIRSNYVGAKTFNFTAGTTNTFLAFNLNGTSGNLYTVTSTSTSQATLTKAGTWYVGANSVDSGNNTGLTFSNGSGINYLNVSYINGVSVGTQGNFFSLLS